MSLKLERARLDLTQEELAKLVGVTAPTIRKIELGKADTVYMSTVIKLARFFNTNVENIIENPKRNYYED